MRHPPGSVPFVPIPAELLELEVTNLTDLPEIQKRIAQQTKQVEEDNKASGAEQQLEMLNLNSYNLCDEKTFSQLVVFVLLQEADALLRQLVPVAASPAAVASDSSGMDVGKLNADVWSALQAIMLKQIRKLELTAEGKACQACAEKYLQEQEVHTEEEMEEEKKND
jgi:hypothetical protein